MTDSLPIADLNALLEHGGWVRALAFSLAADAATAEDIEQKTWLAAIERPPRTGTNPRAWLGAVVRNIARMHWREQSARRRREKVVSENRWVQESRIATSVQPDSLAERLDTFRKLAVALAELPNPYGATLYLRFFEGLTVREIAERMSVPEPTAQARLARGLSKLRAELASTLGKDWRDRCLVFTVPFTKVASGGLITVLTMTLKTKILIGAAALAVVSLLIQQLWEPADEISITPPDDGIALLENQNSPREQEPLSESIFAAEIQRSTVPLDHADHVGTSITMRAPIGHHGRVLVGETPVVGAEVMHAGESVFTDKDGYFQFREFEFYGLTVISHERYPQLLAFAATKEATYEMAAASFLNVGGTGDVSRTGGAAVSLYWTYEKAGDLVSVDHLRELWSGNLGANGSVLVPNIPTPEHGPSQPIESFLVRIEFPGGPTITALPRVIWTPEPNGGFHCKLQVFFQDRGPVPPTFLLVKEEDSGLPLSRKIAYEFYGYYHSAWHAGQTDADGLLLMDEKIQAHGRAMVWLTPRLTYVETGEELTTVPGGQVLLIPKFDPLEVTLNSPSQNVLPPGVRLEATLVSWNPGWESNSLAALFEAPGAPKFHDWVPISINKPLRLDGGWIGNRVGVAIQAWPGPTLVALEPLVEGEMGLVKLPPLALVHARLGSPNIPIYAGSKLSIWRGPAEQLKPYYFPFLSDRTTSFVVPAGNYPLWFNEPGPSHRPLGEWEFSAGEASIEIPFTDDVKCDLHVEFHGTAVLSAMKLMGIAHARNKDGYAGFWAKPGAEILVSLDVMGMNQPGASDGSPAVAFLGYEGSILVPPEGGSIIMEIPSATLLLRSHSSISREVVVRMYAPNNPESPAIVLNLPAESSQKVLLPPGVYSVENMSGSEKQRVEVFPETEMQVDLR